MYICISLYISTHVFDIYTCAGVLALFRLASRDLWSETMFRYGLTRPDTMAAGVRHRHIYMHACMHACIQTYIHSCMHTNIHTFKQPNNQTYIHTSKHTCIHLHTFSLTMAGGVHTGACKPPRSPSSISPRPPTPWRSRCVFDALAYVMLLQV